MAIKTFINGKENGVITFKGDTEPCAVYANGERQDNISYIPQEVTGENSVTYESEYKKNIRTLKADGNTVQQTYEGYQQIEFRDGSGSETDADGNTFYWEINDGIVTFNGIRTTGYALITLDAGNGALGNRILKAGTYTFTNFWYTENEGDISKSGTDVRYTDLTTNESIYMYISNGVTVKTFEHDVRFNYFQKYINLNKQYDNYKFAIGVLKGSYSSLASLPTYEKYVGGIPSPNPGQVISIPYPTVSYESIYDAVSEYTLGSTGYTYSSTSAVSLPNAVPYELEIAPGDATPTLPDGFVILVASSAADILYPTTGNAKYLYQNGATNKVTVSAPFYIGVGNESSTITEVYLSYMYSFGLTMTPTEEQKFPIQAYPQEIENAQGTKNLLPYPYVDGDSKTSVGVTFTVDANGEFTLDGKGDWAQYNILNYSNSTELIEANRGKTLILSSSLYCNGFYIVLVIKKTDETTITELLQKPYYFTITEDISAINITLRIRYSPTFNNTKLTVTLTEKKPTFLSYKGANLFSLGVPPYSAGTVSTLGGITYTVQEDGGIRVQGTKTGNTYFVFAEEVTMDRFGAGTYTLSGGGKEIVEGLSLKFRKFNANGTSVQLGYSRDPITATLTEGEKLCRFAILVGDGEYDSVVYPMLNYGDKPLLFSIGKYKDLYIPSSITVNGEEVELRLGKISVVHEGVTYTATDYIEVNRLENRVIYHQELDNVILTNQNATFIKTTLSGKTVFRSSSITNAHLNRVPALANKYFCYTTVGYALQHDYGISFDAAYWGFASPTLTIVDPRFDNLADFLADLEQNPLEIEYQLKTPIEHDITNTDLGQQLLDLATENHQNTITITSDLSTSALTVNYAKYGGTT